MTTPRLAKTAARGYGARHQALRKEWAPLVEQGGIVCWRCGVTIEPGQPWDLGHDDHDRSITRGPEHLRCNRGTNRRGRPRNRRTASRSGRATLQGQTYIRQPPTAARW